MKDAYQFDYDPGRRYARVKLNGIWDQEIFDAFAARALIARNRVEQAGHRDNAGRILLDLSDYPVQPRNITDQIATLLPMFGDRADRVAVVRSLSALQWMQMRRLLPAEKIRSFDTLEDAAAWLGVAA